MANPRAELRLRDVLMRNVDLYGSDDALVFQGESISWSELSQRVFRLANSLAGAGVGRGSRVAVLQRNGPEIEEIYFAVALLGAAAVPVSHRLAPAEVAYVLADAQVSFAFIEQDHPAMSLTFTYPVVATRCADYQQFRDGGADIEPASEESGLDPVFLLYTSGTTGRPKGAISTQGAMINNGLTIHLAQQLTHADIFLTTTPLTHAASGTRVFSLAVGGVTHVVLERYTPEIFIDAVERHKVSTTILVPTMLQDLLDSPALDVKRLASLRALVYGAAPTPLPLIERAIDTLPCGFVQGYGSTEGAPSLTILTPEEHRRFRHDPALRYRLESIGRPVAGVQMRIVDNDGNTAKKGEAGSLVLRGVKAMAGYWNLPDETENAFRDGWLDTGDVARQDEEGYLFLLDRKKDMLISGGLNVYPSEIERVLNSDPGVSECAVVGAPDDRWGEVPIAFVVAAGDDPTDRLLESCRAELAGYKQPRRIVLVESLPHNHMGKILKTELREWAASGAPTERDSQ